jgi:hypothetical protein
MPSIYDIFTGPLPRFQPVAEQSEHSGVTFFYAKDAASNAPR